MDRSAQGVKIEREGTASAPRDKPSAAAAPRGRRSDSSLREEEEEEGSFKEAEKPAIVHDAVVQIIISSRDIQALGGSADVPERSVSVENHVQASMVISIWMMDNQRYFTLSFTSASTSHLPMTTKQSRTVARTPTKISLSPPLERSPCSSNDSAPRSRGSSSSPSAAITSPSNIPLAFAPFPLPGAPSGLKASSSASILQKVTRLKDGVLNAMEIPVFAMWKDESLAFPNKAAAKLTQRITEPLGSDSGGQRHIKVYTEDFEHELEPDEYPLVKLCRTQQPFSNWKIGLKSPQTERRLT